MKIERFTEYRSQDGSQVFISEFVESSKAFRGTWKKPDSPVKQLGFWMQDGKFFDKSKEGLNVAETVGKRISVPLSEIGAQAPRAEAQSVLSRRDHYILASMQGLFAHGEVNVNTAVALADETMSVADRRPAPCSTKKSRKKN